MVGVRRIPIAPKGAHYIRDVERKTNTSRTYEVLTTLLQKFSLQCSTACVDEFKKEPQKYIQKVEEELKTAKQRDPAEKTDMNKKDETPMDMHGGHHK